MNFRVSAVLGEVLHSILPCFRLNPVDGFCIIEESGKWYGITEEERKMEDRNQEKRQALRSRISIVSLAVLAVVILACYAAQSRNLIEWEMALGILTGFLVFYWILMDVAEPVLLHEMKDMPAKKKVQYLKFAGIDLAGYGALVYFVYNIGKSNESAVIGAVIYVFCLNLGRKEKGRFYEETWS